MLNICPKCNKKNFIKAGVINNNQRYKCKECGYHFSSDKIGKPNYLKRVSLIMFLEGFTLRQIAGELKVSNVTIMNWLSQYGTNLKEIRSKKPDKINKIRTIDIDRLVDEMDEINERRWILVGNYSGYEKFILLK